jgi:hypothetical protein
MEPPAASYVPTVRSPIGEHSTSHTLRRVSARPQDSGDRSPRRRPCTAARSSMSQSLMSSRLSPGRPLSAGEMSSVLSPSPASFGRRMLPDGRPAAPWLSMNPRGGGRRGDQGSLVRAESWCGLRCLVRRVQRQQAEWSFGESWTYRRLGEGSSEFLNCWPRVRVTPGGGCGPAQRV